LADVATLVFDIDSSGAAGAAKALAGLNRYAAATATVMAKLEKKGHRANGQFQTQIEYVAASEKEIRKLAASYNPVLSASLRLSEAQKDLARAVQLGVISTSQQAVILRDLQAQYTATATSSKALATEQKNVGYQTANVFAQLNDIGVMLAAGQNPIQLALQQGTQLNQVWASMGAQGRTLSGVTGMLRNAFASMISPMNLLTLGAIAGGAALFQLGTYLYNTTTSAASLDDTISLLAARIDGLDSAVEMSLLPMDQLIAKYGAAAAAAREWLLINIQKEVLETNDALRKQSSALSSLAKEYASALNPTMEMLKVELNAIEDDFGLVGVEASQFREILFSIRSADGLEKQVEYLEEMRVFLKENNIEIEGMPKGFAKSLVELSPLVAKAWELAEANRAAAAAALSMTKATPLYEQGWGESALLPPAATKDKPRRAGGGGGGGALKQAEKQFQSLRELLEKETVFQVAEYEKRQGQLDAALNKRLITEQQYNEIRSQLRTSYFGSEYEQSQLEYDMSLEQLTLALDREFITRQQYEDRVAQLNAQRRASELSHYGNFFSNLVSAAQAGGDRMTGVVKAFSIAQGLINSYLAYTQVLADPSLVGRPFLRTALAASTLASGLAQVANMRGGGGSSSASSATSAATRQEPSKTILVRLDGPDWATDMVESVITQIQEQSKDGRYIIQRD